MDEGEGRWREGKGGVLSVGEGGWEGCRVGGVLSTNGAITARCAQGLSSGEEPDLVDWCFMSGKLHLALSSAWVPHSDTAVSTLQGARANRRSGPHTLNTPTRLWVSATPHPHRHTTKGEGCS